MSCDIKRCTNSDKQKTGFSFQWLTKTTQIGGFSEYMGLQSKHKCNHMAGILSENSIQGQACCPDI